MTMHGLDEVKADGIDFVFNTPNDQSRPGYLKMGWQVVGRLPVAVRVAGVGNVRTLARSRAAASHWPLDLDIGCPVDEVLDELATTVAGIDDPRALHTRTSREFFSWRYGADFLGYRAVSYEQGHCWSGRDERGAGRELVVLGAPGLTAEAADVAASAAMNDADATHALRLGDSDVRHGFVPVPNLGPVMTWRSVNAAGMPPLSNWNLTMGDVELF